MLSKEEEDQEYLEELSAEAALEEQEELQAQISAHAIHGTTPANNTSILHIMVGKKKAVALVDTGSSGTFIDSKFAQKAGCKISSAKPMTVIVANGAEIKSNAACSDCQYTVQGYTFKNDFRLLQLKGYDIILGTDWMLTHSPVKWDFKSQSLKIRYYGLQKIIFRPDTHPLECSVIPSEQLDKAMSKAVLGAIIYAATSPAEETSTPENNVVSDILDQFNDIFYEPEKLPPARDCDHQIDLLPGTKPVNKRAYRLPAYQKDALEKIIDQLIKSEVIRISLSPFSSPEILVRKKHGSWRLCIDYRQLNANTVKNKYPIPVIEDLLDELFVAKKFPK
jgi:hypothetical protein